MATYNRLYRRHLLLYHLCMKKNWELLKKFVCDNNFHLFIFVVISVLLIGGVIASFYYEKKLETIDDVPSLSNFNNGDVVCRPAYDCGTCDPKDSNLGIFCEENEKSACYKDAVCGYNKSTKSCEWFLTDDQKVCIEKYEN